MLKALSIFVSIFVWSSFSLAVKTAAPSKSSTTITVEDGVELKTDREFEITTGNGEIEGDPQVLKNAARESWKKACDDWKKEIRELNNDEKVLALSCGSPHCSTEGGQTLCHSDGEYKLKIRVRSAPK